MSQAAAVIALSWETNKPETFASRVTEWWKTGGHGQKMDMLKAAEMIRPEI